MTDIRKVEHYNAKTGDMVFELTWATICIGLTVLGAAIFFGGFFLAAKVACKALGYAGCGA